MESLICDVKMIHVTLAVFSMYKYHTVKILTLLKYSHYKLHDTSTALKFLL